MAYKLSHDEYISKVREMNPDIDTSKIIYVTSRKRVNVTCRTCGHAWTPIARALICAKKIHCKMCSIKNRKPVARVTAEAWWARARRHQRNVYTCNLANYVNQTTPIEIICPTHGPFMQLPSSHARGTGCKKCGHRIVSELRRDQHISVIEGRYTDIYDLSKIDYVDQDTPVLIICSIHGEFKDTPRRLLKGIGCPSCTKNITIDPAKLFIAKARRIHGDKYNYSQVVYKSSKTVIDIICPIHGKFEQTPGAHLQGSSCTACSNIESAARRRGTTDNFIVRGKKIHGDRYDYSLVEYYDYNTPVTIVCPKHGKFTQTPNKHLSTDGCTDCIKELHGPRLRYTTAEYVARLTLIHKNKYNYDKVIYRGGDSSIIITCPIHGDFTKKASVHSEGTGCPACGVERLSITHDEFVCRLAKVHPELIVDDKTKYTKHANLVTVKCKIHGYFSKNAGELLRRR